MEGCSKEKGRKNFILGTDRMFPLFDLSEHDERDVARQELG